MINKIAAIICVLLGMYTVMTTGSHIECLLYYILAGIFLIVDKLENLNDNTK